MLKLNLILGTFYFRFCYFDQSRPWFELGIWLHTLKSISTKQRFGSPFTLKKGRELEGLVFNHAKAASTLNTSTLNSYTLNYLTKSGTHFPGSQILFLLFRQFVNLNAHCFQLGQSNPVFNFFRYIVNCHGHVVLNGVFSG